MSYTSNEDKERLKWMSLKEAVDYITKAVGLEIGKARKQLVSLISDRPCYARYDDDPKILRKPDAQGYLRWPYRPTVKGINEWPSADDYMSPERGKAFLNQAQTIDWEAGTIFDSEFSANRLLVVKRTEVEKVWHSPTPEAEDAENGSDSPKGNAKYPDDTTVNRAKELLSKGIAKSKRDAAKKAVNEEINAGSPIKGASIEAWIARIRVKMRK